MLIMCASCGVEINVPPELLGGIESVDQVEPYICDACESTRDEEADERDHDQTIDFDCCPRCGSEKTREDPVEGFYYCADCGWNEQEDEERSCPCGCDGDNPRCVHALSYGPPQNNGVQPTCPAAQVEQ